SSTCLKTWIARFFSTRPLAAHGASRRTIGRDNLLGTVAILDNHDTSLLLYDLDGLTVNYEENSLDYTIPASMVRLFTFYLGTMVLKDSTTLLRFVPNGDEVTIWGTGDPSWRYDKLPEPRIREFFAPYKKIHFSNADWQDDALGYGWQWDDYHF